MWHDFFRQVTIRAAALWPAPKLVQQAVGKYVQQTTVNVHPTSHKGMYYTLTDIQRQVTTYVSSNTGQVLSWMSPMVTLGWCILNV